MLSRLLLFAAIALPSASAADESCVRLDNEMLIQRLTCAAVPGCDLAQLFPEDSSRQDKAMVAAENALLTGLESQTVCLTYSEVSELADVQSEYCYESELILGITLIRMIEDGAISASNPNNLPGSSFGLAKNGSCV
jgi:hypothetical protein